MRRPIIAGNWKMNLVLGEARALVSRLLQWRDVCQTADVIVAPPFTALQTVKELIRESRMHLAAQNLYFESKGAYTGEISAAMLKDLGCRFVILGHSERRRYFHEDDALINKKIKSALAMGLNVIFCIGETLEQRENNQTRQVVENQLQLGLNGLNSNDLKGLVLAYEPVWAIGTGKTATPRQAQEIHQFSRELIGRTFGGPAAENIRIQYGGSVTPENSKDLLKQEDIDGALVGSASLNADSFYAIIKSAD